MSRKIRIISSGYIVFSALLAVVLVSHYGYFHLGHFWRDSTALAQLPPFPHPMIEIPRSSQIFIAILDMLPLVPSLCALYFGARVMADFRSGRYFTVTVTRSMSRGGLSVIALAVLKLLSLNLMIPYVFSHDPMADMPILMAETPIKFIIDPTIAGFLLAGVMIWIIGWVLTQALVLKAENESIV